MGEWMNRETRGKMHDARHKIEVSLKPITADNWKGCIDLKVKDEQADFVPSNLYSIAEAQFYPQAAPLAIYSEQGQMVGFVLYGVDVENGKWKIFRLMIDHAHQGKGYGRAAMKQVIERLRSRPDCNEILIAYQTDNDAARQLYASLGFIEEIVSDGKVTARLDLNKERLR
jgi:diamine N-acetyltransferase